MTVWLVLLLIAVAAVWATFVALKVQGRERRLQASADRRTSSLLQQQLSLGELSRVTDLYADEAASLVKEARALLDRCSETSKDDERDGVPDGPPQPAASFTQMVTAVRASMAERFVLGWVEEPSSGFLREVVSITGVERARTARHIDCPHCLRLDERISNLGLLGHDDAPSELVTYLLASVTAVSDFTVLSVWRRFVEGGWAGRFAPGEPSNDCLLSPPTRAELTYPARRALQPPSLGLAALR